MLIYRGTARVIVCGDELMSVSPLVRGLDAFGRGWSGTWMAATSAESENQEGALLPPLLSLLSR